MWERGSGGEGSGEAGFSSHGDDPAPSPGFQPGEEEAAPSASILFSRAFLPPSPAPRERGRRGGPGSSAV